MLLDDTIVALAKPPPWEAAAVHSLAEFGEKRYLVPRSLLTSNYSTAAFLGVPGTTRAVDRARRTRSSGWLVTRLEAPGDEARASASTQGLRLLERAPTASELAALRDAERMIEISGPFRSSVADLCLSMHLLEVPSPDVDVSFSLPSIPFSIFVSIPVDGGANISAARLSESIIHETMHLQLSFVEAMFPLVLRSQEVFASPWRQEYREAVGILHGLFVFKMIDCLWSLPAFGADGIRAFAHKRVEEIRSQIVAVSDFSNASALTPLGHEVVRALLG